MEEVEEQGRSGSGSGRAPARWSERAAAALREATGLLPCPRSPSLAWSPPLASLLPTLSSLLPPPSTAESGVGHARAGGGPRAAVEDMVWRREARPAAAVRRMREPAAGRTGSAGRGPLVAGSTATIFFADVA